MAFSKTKMTWLKSNFLRNTHFQAPDFEKNEGIIRW